MTETKKCANCGYRFTLTDIQHLPGPVCDACHGARVAAVRGGARRRVNETATQQRYKEFVDPLRNAGPGPIVPAGPAVKADLPDTNPKSRVGLTKPSLNAIPAAALLHLGAAMDDGKKKYGLFNWREHSVACSVYEDAIWRHLLAWRDGEDVARDSGQHHLAHVMACCAILLDAKETNNLIDDRGPAGEAAELIDKWTEQPDG